MTDGLRKHRANCGGLCCRVRGIARAADLWGFDCQTPLAEGSWLCYLQRGAHPPALHAGLQSSRTFKLS